MRYRVWNSMNGQTFEVRGLARRLNGEWKKEVEE